jgi:hypothetical protein
MLWLLITVNIVHSSLILVTLMVEVMRSSKTLILARATWHHIPEDGIIHSHGCENLESHILLCQFTKRTIELTVVITVG